MTPRLLPLLLAALLLPSGVAAQAVPSPYRFIEHEKALEAFVSYLDMDPGELGLGPEAGVLVGARFSMDVADPVSAEGAVFYFPSERAVLNPARDPDDLLVGEADMHLLGLEGSFRFNPVGRRTWHGLAPFLLASGGLVVDFASESDLEAEFQEGDVFDFGTSFMGRIGGGSLWFHSDRWVVRGEASLTLWQVDTPEGFLRSDRPFGAVPEDEWVGGLQISVGLSYRF